MAGKKDDDAQEWVTRHPPEAVNRVLKRLERFAGNTVHEATASAAKDLLDVLTAAQKVATPPLEDD